jgi:pyruvate/2-oxoglutarate dehydrogenase complex dihydrolipoamide dehydrogenase (E3) component
MAAMSVGLEFAQMYRRVGSEVIVVEMGSRLMQREDEDVFEVIKTILENEGINIRRESQDGKF